MDNRRPALELKHFKDIYQRSHENGESSWTPVTICNTSLFEVPVIVVFTKYDQFLRNVQIDLEDRNYEDPSIDISEEAKEKAVKEIFEEHYLRPLGDGVVWVRLQSEFGIKCLGNVLMFLTDMGMKETRCNNLLEVTATALNEEVVALMLVAVQKDNVGLSVNLALKR